MKLMQVPSSRISPLRAAVYVEGLYTACAYLRREDAHIAQLHTSLEKRPRRLPRFREESPMGSCHRGGTFKVVSPIRIAGSAKASVGSTASGRDKAKITTMVRGIKLPSWWVEATHFSHARL